MPLVSIITAAYNSEKYIGKTIETVRNQSFDDWEYIIIDDGSTDNTLQIIKNYAEKDKRIRYKSISNSGSARRPFGIGISIAEGAWIFPLGHDDYLESKDIEKLYQRSVETEADIVLQRMVAFEKEGETKFTIPGSNFSMDRVISGKEACALTIGKWEISANGMLCKRSFYVDLYKNYPDERNLLNLDEIDTRRLFLSVKRVAFCEASYFYWVHPNSITRKPSIKRFDVLETNRMLNELIEENYKNEDLSVVEDMHMQYLRVLVSCQVFYFHYKSTFREEDKTNIKEQLKVYHQKVKSTDCSGIPFWMKFILLGNYNFFKLVTYTYSLLKR